MKRYLLQQYPGLDSTENTDLLTINKKGNKVGILLDKKLNSSYNYTSKRGSIRDTGDLVRIGLQYDKFFELDYCQLETLKQLMYLHDKLLLDPKFVGKMTLLSEEDNDS